MCNECNDNEIETSIEMADNADVSAEATDETNAINDDAVEDPLIEKEPDTETTVAPQVVSAQNIWIMNSMTRDVIKHGTGRRALQLNRTDLSGKTGTTNDQHDAWFSGFNANIVTICWVGFDKFQPLGSRETGARAALPMWIDYMKVALDGMPNTIMERPKGLVNARIDPVTGQLATANNPDAIFEVFRIEQAPSSIAETKQPDVFLQNPGSGAIPEQLF